MKLSLEWLNRYVGISDIPPDEIAHRLTMATAEVEHVDRLERVTRGIVTARVIAIEPIDAGPGKTVNYVTVDTGKGQFATVCGAPNVAVGMLSAFASPGTTVAGGVAVSGQTRYGRASDGMLLSAKELGWGDSHAGIMAFPESVGAGADLADLVPAVDHIIDIDNKTITHRPDLWGHYGFARELAAIYGRELRPLNVADAETWASLPSFPLAIEDMENCPGYACLDIGNLRPAMSPLDIQYLLLAIGLRPINLLVDLTNFIMCELGQPMHAFDGERVRDIVVKPFGKPGTFRTLDSIDRDMRPEDLMIWDHTGPIALAGIMGGEETEITGDTARVLLESANFNPARIRRTGLRLNLRSDASMRFEKGQPPYHMAVSIARFVRLLEDAGQDPAIRSRLTIAGDAGTGRRTITVDAGLFARRMGVDIPVADVRGILGSLGFETVVDGDEMTVTVPPYRGGRDIGIPEDLVEEVARIYGYDNIVPSMPDVELRPYTFNSGLQTQRKIRRFLSEAKGFVEVQTYSWYDDPWLKQLAYDPGETFVIQNPAAEGNTRIRRDLLPNLLALVEPNALHRDRFRLYELGNVHLPAGDGREQQLHLAGIAYRADKLGGLQDLVLEMKGVIEDVFALANSAPPVFDPVEDCPYPWQRPDATLWIRSGGETVGAMGFATDRNWTVLGKGTWVVWFELALDGVMGPVYPDAEYREIPVYPGSWMDFSILADAASSYCELESVLDGFSHEIVRGRRFMYLYDGKGVPEGKISYTFRYWLGLRGRTLTGDDLSVFHEMFRTFLESRGLSLR